MNLRRRTLAALLVCGAMPAFGPAFGQRSAPARVGYLSSGLPPEGALEAMRLGFRDLGYVEGKTFVIVPRYAEGDLTRMPKLVQELVAERIDVLVSRGA